MNTAAVEDLVLTRRNGSVSSIRIQVPCRIVRGVTGRKPKMRSTSWREDKGSEEGSRAIGLNAIRVQTHKVNVVES